MKKPIVSVIMATYNDDLYLKKSVESVLTQSLNNFELVIVNDASTDNTVNIIKSISKKDKRIVYVKNSRRMGLIASLNAGIKISKGKYIARLDSDDLWINDAKLMKSVELLEKKPEIVLVGSWARRINTNNKVVAYVKYPLTDTEIRNYLMIENCFVHSSVLFRKNIVDKVGAYDSQFDSAEDYGLWVKIGTSGKLMNIPEYLVDYRVNPNGISHTRYLTQLNSTIKVVKKYRNFYRKASFGLVLWHIRKCIPRGLREGTSRRARNLLFFTKNNIYSII